MNVSIGPYAADWTDANGTTQTGDGPYTGHTTGITIANDFLRCDAAGDHCSVIPDLAIPNGASRWGYQLTPDDEGHTIRVSQSATNAAGPSEPVVSDPSPVVQYIAPFASGPLGLFGKAVVGEKIGAYNGGWVGSTSYYESYLRCDAAGNDCATIPGAEDWTYTVTSADIGHTLRVREYALNSKGSSEIQTTVPTDVVAGDLPAPTTPEATTPAAVVTTVVVPTPQPVTTPASQPAPVATTPQPAPKIVAVAAVSAGKLQLTSLPLTLKKGAKCPASVTITVKSGSAKVTRKFKTTRSNGVCKVTGSLALTTKLKTATSLTVSTSGAGLKASKRTVPRG